MIGVSGKGPPEKSPSSLSARHGSRNQREGSRFRAIDLIVVGLPIAVVVGGGLQVNVSPADLFLPIAVGSVLLAALRPGDPRKPGGGSRTLVWALYLTASSAALLAGLFIRSVQGVETDFVYGSAAVVKLWISLTYFAVFAVYAASPHGRFDQLLRLWVGASLVAAASGIAGAVLWSRGIDTPFSFDYRATGGFDDPNLFASYLLISIALTFVASSRQLIRRPYVVFAGQAAALLLTGSRAALPALLIGVAGAILLGRKRFVFRRLWPVLVSIIVGFFLAVRYLPDVRLESLSRVADAGDSVESDIRLQLWSLATQMWLDSPVVGVGIGQFRSAAREYVSWEVESIPHSTHLSLLAETGLVGFCLILGLPLLILIRLVKLARAGVLDAGPTWLILGIAGALAMAFTLNLENARFMWAFFGLCSGYVVGAQSGSEPGLGPALGASGWRTPKTPSTGAARAASPYGART